jgi:hypothetical protein
MLNSQIGALQKLPRGIFHYRQNTVKRCWVRDDSTERRTMRRRTSTTVIRGIRRIMRHSNTTSRSYSHSVIYAVSYRKRWLMYIHCFCIFMLMVYVIRSKLKFVLNTMPGSMTFSRVIAIPFFLL